MRGKRANLASHESFERMANIALHIVTCGAGELAR